MSIEEHGYTLIQILILYLLLTQVASYSVQ